MNPNYRITLRCISYDANPSFARLPSKYDGILFYVCLSIELTYRSCVDAIPDSSASNSPQIVE